MEPKFIKSEKMPDMKYEKLAMYAFDCKRWGGPNDVACATVYGSLFVPEMTQEGKIVLIQIIEALINKARNEKEKSEFITLKDSLKGDNIQQRTAISLMDYILDVLIDNS